MKKTKKVSAKEVVKTKKPAAKVVEKPMAKKFIPEPPKPVLKKVVTEPAKPVTDTSDFVAQLEAMRDDLLEIIRKKKEEVIPEPEVGDEADVAVRSVERDLVFEQGGNELHLLEEAEAALRRIEKGIFGLCEACSERIADLRLKAMPYARYCVRCQSRFEHS